MILTFSFVVVTLAMPPQEKALLGNGEPVLYRVEKAESSEQETVIKMNLLGGEQRVLTVPVDAKEADLEKLAKGQGHPEGDKEFMTMRIDEDEPDTVPRILSGPGSGNVLFFNRFFFLSLETGRIDVSQFQNRIRREKSAPWPP